MCSFIIVNKEITDEQLEIANKYSKNRGPDLTSIYRDTGITILHNLLHITGEKTPQPFIKGKWCLREYLLRNNFPFEEGVKRGFQANRNLVC